MENPNAMKKAIVRSAGEAKLSKTQLFNRSETLINSAVNDRGLGVTDKNITMNGVTNIHVPVHSIGQKVPSLSKMGQLSIEVRMKLYLDLMEHVLDHGIQKDDRTGTGTLSAFGYQMRFNLAEGFPLITTKKLHLRSIIYELLWFLKGETNIKYLNDNKVTIWNEWADSNGDLGRVYGAQWRSWRNADGEVIDQISNLIQEIKTNPNSRRMCVVAYNPGEIHKMALPPCHAFFQFNVSEGRLSCQLYQRSADIFLGVPFNIASYALLTMMIAQVCDLTPSDFVHTLGDAHIYKNHIEQARLQISRTPRHLPRMILDSSVKNIFDFKYEDFQLVDYDPHPAIKAEISV